MNPTTATEAGETPLQFVYIYLAQDEWTTNTNLQDVASDYLNTVPAGEREDVLVEVYEHAGWWMAFAWNNGKVICVGTANDMATFDEEQKAVQARLWGNPKRKRTLRDNIRRIEKNRK